MACQTAAAACKWVNLSPTRLRLLRGRRAVFLMSSASALLIFLTSFWALGVSPLLQRDYDTQDFDNPMSLTTERRYRGGSSSSSVSAPGNDVVLRFHAALLALRSLDGSTGSESNSSASSGDQLGSGSAARPGGVSESAALLPPEAACPTELQLGPRPSQHTAALLGNACEPWAGRRAVLLMQMLLSPAMVGLEWGAGASTPWYLARLGRLVSIEHRQDWADKVRVLAERSYAPAALAARWELHVVPPRGDVLTFGDSECYDVFRAYVDAGFLEHSERPRFDFIAIDGAARVACFQRALWMLKSHGGVLLLNNAQRRAYREVFALTPKRWLRFEDSSVLSTTVIWVSCDAGRC